MVLILRYTFYMKVIIAGCRNFHNYELFRESLISFIASEYGKGNEIKISCILSGGATGVDKLGEQFAVHHEIPLIIFPAEWNKHGKAAGPIRNSQMVEAGDLLLAWWDGQSRGTKNIIDQMTKANKPGYVFSLEEDIITKVDSKI